MFALQLTAEQRLQKAIGRILHEDKYKPLAGIIMLGERRVCDKTRTASTNGRDEKYGRKFIEKLKDSELRFVVIHECYHKMYRHLITWKHLSEICARTANMAMDYVINLKIADENKDGFCTMPMKPDGTVMGLIDEKYRGMDTAKVFWEIYKKKKEQGDGGKGNGNGSDGNGKGDGDGEGDGGFDEHDWDGAKEMDGEEKRHLEQEIDNAIRQGALSAGKMGLDAERTFGELLEVQVDWKEVLREFITTTCSGKDYSTWRRPNRRFMSAGVYMPSAISERVDELVLAVDTSGSIGDKAIRVFLTEVKGICDHVKPERVRLLYWGSTVVADETYEHKDLGDLVKSTKPRGGGGTDVECVVTYMHDKKISPQAVICLTDGELYGGWGQWSAPILWAILDNKSAKPTCGKTVHIKSDTM